MARVNATMPTLGLLVRIPVMLKDRRVVEFDKAPDALKETTTFVA